MKQFYDNYKSSEYHIQSCSYLSLSMGMNDAAAKVVTDKQTAIPFTKGSHYSQENGDRGSPCRVPILGDPISHDSPYFYSKLRYNNYKLRYKPMTHHTYTPSYSTLYATTLLTRHKKCHQRLSFLLCAYHPYDDLC